MTLPHRPAVRVHVPREIRAGQTIEPLVVLDAKREVKVESVTATLFGYEQLQANAKRVLLKLQAKLLGASVLPKGERQLRFRATLPENLPPRYLGRLYQVLYSCDVHVDLPWWPDRRASFVLTVLPPDLPLPDEQPFHFSTRPEGPVAGKLHIEGVVDQRVLMSGGVLAGSVVLSNLALGYRYLHMSLVATERLSGSQYEAKRWTLDLQIPSVEGQAVPFRMKVPDVTPSFLGPSGGLSWAIEISAKAGMNSLKVPIPVRMVAPGPNAESRKVAPALPRIGSERITKLWEKVAAEHGFVVQGDGMQSRQRDVDVRITRDARGRDGVFLCCELNYPSLGLELLAHPRSELGKTVQAVINADDPLKSYEVLGRETAQAKAFLASWWEPGSDLLLAEIRDERATFEVAGSGQNEAGLSRFVALVQRMVRRFFAARETVPLPTELATAEAAWVGVAQQLQDAVLVRGAVFVRGTLDGVSVEAGHAWDDRVQCIARVFAEQPLDPTFVVGDAEHVESLDISSEARGLLQSLLEHGTVVVEPRQLELRWPEGPIEDPREVLPSLRRLLRLRLALRSNVGPYR